MISYMFSEQCFDGETYELLHKKEFHEIEVRSHYDEAKSIAMRNHESGDGFYDLDTFDVMEVLVEEFGYERKPNKKNKSVWIHIQD